MRSTETIDHYSKKLQIIETFDPAEALYIRCI